MNLKMDDRKSKEEEKKKETNEEDEIEHTPTVGIQYHE